MIIGAEEGPSHQFVQTEDQAINLCIGRRQLPHTQQSSHHLLFIRREPSTLRMESREDGSVAINYRKGDVGSNHCSYEK